MKFITIKESNNAANLAVLKSRLESVGIHCQIDGELSNQVLNYIPLIRVKLQVLEEDLDKVKKIMIENGDWVPEKSSLVCPKCQSNQVKIVFNPKSIFKILKGFILATFAINPGFSMYNKVDLVCKDCGHRFSN